MTTLSDEQLYELANPFDDQDYKCLEGLEVVKFARAVIAAHEQARGQDFRTLLEEAVDDIEDLAGYAPKYFREKLNIEGTLAKYRAALSGGPEDLLALRKAREALVELVALKDLKNRIADMDQHRSTDAYREFKAMVADYDRRKPIAWANARAALAGAGESK